MLIAGYLFLNEQVSNQSSYSLPQFKQALTEKQVTQVKIHQNREIPTGQIIVQLRNGEQRQFYVSDVQEAEKLTEQAGLIPIV